MSQQNPQFNADDAFKAWWYDYCVKNGHHNPVKLREVAEAAWRARAPRSERGIRQTADGKTVRKERHELPELVAYWKTKERGSDQFAAAEIIERLLSDLAVAEGEASIAYEQRDAAWERLK